MARDDADVPPIMVKCCEAIEKYGLKSQGIYRISGTTSKIGKLKERLDKGALWRPVWQRAARSPIQLLISIAPGAAQT